MGTWTLRHWAVATAVTFVAGVVIGVPTGVVSTPFYSRMTPVLWWNYPVWAVTSVLEGLLVATYVTRRDVRRREPETGAGAKPRTARALTAGLLSAFAVGCPVCNKLVVLALGVSGALSYWAPAQPVLAVASLGLLTHALTRRLRTADACPVPGIPGAPHSDAHDELQPAPRSTNAGAEGSGRETTG